MTNPTGTVDLAPGIGHYVYRGYAANGRLLYVGVAEHLWRRLGDHDRRNSAWFDYATRVAWELFPDRRSALEEEARLIRTKHPDYNIVGRWPRKFHVVLTADDAHEPGCVTGLRERIREFQNEVAL